MKSRKDDLVRVRAQFVTRAVYITPVIIQTSTSTLGRRLFKEMLDSDLEYFTAAHNIMDTINLVLC